MTPLPPGLALAHQHGVTVVLDADGLRLITPVKPSNEVLAALREDKAAIIAYLLTSESEDRNEAGSAVVAGPLPPALAEVEVWRASFARLSPHIEPCPGFRADGEWPRVHAAVAAFLDADAGPWARIAAEQQWTDLELLAVHRKVGAANLAACGALLSSNGVPVTQVTETLIRFRNGLAARRIPMDPARAVALWDYERRTS
jgi:hypothetical protein